MEERKRKTMKINAIGVTTFGNKQQFVKLLKMKLSKVTTKAGILVILSAAVMIAIARDDITDFRN